MSQLDKLKQLQKQQQSQASKSSMTAFDDIVVINVGVPPREHFPKLKDENGNNIKDEKGNDLRSDKSDGLTYTFTEFGTGKLVKVVLGAGVKDQLQLLASYTVGGLGYDIRNANMIFIEQNSKITNF